MPMPIRASAPAVAPLSAAPLSLATPSLAIAAPDRVQHVRRLPFDTQSPAWGYVCGCILALGASISFAMARAGVIAGLAPGDLVLARFGVAGLLLSLPLLRWGITDLAGIGWRRGLVLALLGGPAFALMQLGGYAFAPLAHGAVIHPASVTVLSTGIAAFALGERLSRAHVVGSVLVIAGIVLISWQGLQAHAGEQSWIGDLLFFSSAVIWAGFTVLVRHWQLHAVRAIAVVSFLSMIVVAPAYVAWFGIDHLRDLPPVAMGLQLLSQGLLQGVIAITAYSQAIRVLGVSRAVLFPAMVPAVSMVIGIPIVGEIPNTIQLAGLACVTIGLLGAIGVFTRLARRFLD